MRKLKKIYIFFYKIGLNQNREGGWVKLYKKNKLKIISDAFTMGGKMRKKK